ncbi:TM0106 family RecB-like putative nuclease [Sphingobium tyrosinilyticum]|uniref:TM0106 family RecB-like putative nuclease n=1 Tax=Sphingobium tyrosinilyticum TaxID=2715436 RepID=A0ABV9F4B8_9SPHN
MKKVDNGLRLSASDLMRFKVCQHATTLDLRRIEIGDITPTQDSEEAALLQKQGDAHELGFLQSLKDSGRKIVEIPKDGLPLEESVRLTLEAMAAGPDIIFQGAFLDGDWGGYSDFLERVEQPSALGGWSYEVIDTKLKRTPDPKHILQLVLYSDLVAKIQGRTPDLAHLQLGDGSRFSVRLSQVASYARHARSRFENFLVERPSTRPEPVSGCSLCPWSFHCESEWDAADSLALLAGISRNQRAKLEAAGISTIAQLGSLDHRIPKLAPETQDRLHVQARLQNARRQGGSPQFELRPYEAGRGFALLPAPDEGDLFYDIEGDPYFTGGLEYLHGVWFRVKGEWAFKAFWAHDRAAEGEAVKQLLVFFTEHLQRHPKAHMDL